MKKILVCVAVLGSLSTAAFADQPTTTPPGNSTDSNASACGTAHAAAADVNGNFGWLGALGGTPGYHNATGQEPDATGYNNSHTNCQTNKNSDLP